MLVYKRSLSVYIRVISAYYLIALYVMYCVQYEANQIEFLRK